MRQHAEIQYPSKNSYEIGRVKVGGQPGETPTWLIGSIFWLGQKMVSDANKGIFDAAAAEDIINRCQTQSDITGVPFALDIVGTTEAAFEKYFDFVSKHTDDVPLMLDAMSPRTRMAAANVAKKMGLTKRCFYNSIYKGVTDAELANLKKAASK
jgi:tetrahydromethanopterin S-methyltransferase subunit H